MKERFRKLFIDFLIKHGKDDNLSNDLQLLKSFDKLWDDKYSINSDKFFEFCNTLLYNNQIESNKTDIIKFRIYSVIRWLIESGHVESLPAKNSIKKEINLDELNQSIDNICYKLNNKKEIYIDDINKFFKSFSKGVDLNEVKIKKFRLKFLIKDYIRQGFIETSEGTIFLQEIESMSPEYFDMLWDEKFQNLVTKCIDSSLSGKILKDVLKRKEN